MRGAVECDDPRVSTWPAQITPAVRRMGDRALLISPSRTAGTGPAPGAALSRGPGTPQDAGPAHGSAPASSTQASDRATPSLDAPSSHVPGVTEWVLATVAAALAAWPTALVQPGLAAVMVEFPGSAPTPQEARRALLHAGLMQHESGQASHSRPVEHLVPTRYHGTDLAEVARSLQVSPAVLIARHAATRWTVAAVGFSPGFAYLVGEDPIFRQVARRSDPRTRVPAGSVALAAGMCAVYPSASPGGWQLIGTSDFVAFDPAASPPALFAVGDTVRFLFIAEGVEFSSPRDLASADASWRGTGAAAPDMPVSTGTAVPTGVSAPIGIAGAVHAPPRHAPGSAVRVTGLTGSALFEDAGRQHVLSGVPRSGAFDRGAQWAATRLVGGTQYDAAIEIVGHMTLANGSSGHAIAVTGMGDASIDGASMPTWTCLWLPPGATLDIVAPTCAYLAIAGGFAAERVMGSRSTCLLGPLGPSPIRRGQSLTALKVPDDPRRVVGSWCPQPQVGTTLRAVPGPHLDLPDTGGEVLATSRIGVRIRPAQRLAAGGSLPSVPVRPGAIQVLPSGDWILLGPDCGTMGGYPLAGVVTEADHDLVAHLLPGQQVHLQPTVRALPPHRPRIVRPGPWP